MIPSNRLTCGKGGHVIKGVDINLLRVSVRGLSFALPPLAGRNIKVMGVRAPSMFQRPPRPWGFPGFTSLDALARAGHCTGSIHFSPNHPRHPAQNFLSFLKVYLFERDSACAREHRYMRAGEGQKEKERERISNRLHTVSAEPDVGLNLTVEIMT